MPTGEAGWPAARDRRHPASTPPVPSSRPGLARHARLRTARFANQGICHRPLPHASRFSIHYRNRVLGAPRLELTTLHDEPVLVVRRAFKAPASLVFEAWTEPRHLRHWRVPHGFELVVCEVNLRVGGGYRFVHRAPDGSQHAFSGQYRQIERPGRLVSTLTYEAAPENEATDDVTFEDNGGTTLVTGRPSPRSRRGNCTPPRAPSAGSPSATNASTGCSQPFRHH